MTAALKFLAMVAVLAAAAPPASAADIVRCGFDGMAFVLLRPTDQPGAVAELIFRNDERHTTYHEERLDLAGVDVRIEIFVNVPDAGDGGSLPDRLVVHVPDGLVAVPADTIVPEGEVRRVLIYPIGAVGM